MQELPLAKLLGSLLTECEFHNVKKLNYWVCVIYFKCACANPNGKSKSHWKTSIASWLVCTYMQAVRRTQVSLKCGSPRCVRKCAQTSHGLVGQMYSPWLKTDRGFQGRSTRKNSNTCWSKRPIFVCFLFNPEEIQWTTIHHWKEKRLTSTKDYVNFIKKDSVKRHLVASNWITFLNWSCL